MADYNRALSGRYKVTKISKLQIMAPNFNELLEDVNRHKAPLLKALNELMESFRTRSQVPPTDSKELASDTDKYFRQFSIWLPVNNQSNCHRQPSTER